MKDDTTKNAWLYGHMREASPLNIGDSVTYGTYVGHEGETGFATGIHLHLMGQYLGDSDTWIFGLPISQLLNPATEIIGIPNQYNISAIYYGTPIPPPPPPPPPPITHHKSIKWLMNRKNLRLYY